MMWTGRPGYAAVAKAAGALARRPPTPGDRSGDADKRTGAGRPTTVAAGAFRERVHPRGMVPGGMREAPETPLSMRARWKERAGGLEKGCIREEWIQVACGRRQRIGGIREEWIQVACGRRQRIGGILEGKEASP